MKKFSFETVMFNSLTGAADGTNVKFAFFGGGEGGQNAFKMTDFMFGTYSNCDVFLLLLFHNSNMSLTTDLQKPDKWPATWIVLKIL